MDSIQQDIRENTFRPVYLLYGPEAFLKRSYKNRLKQALTQGDTTNFHAYEGKGISFDEIRDLADTMPFFAEHRMILLENTGLLKSASEQWSEWIATIPETTTVLFVEDEVDKRSKLYKAVVKHGLCEECARQSADQLRSWCVRYLGHEGKRISRSAVELLLARAGEDMENLRSEMEKLLAYAGEAEGITEEMVEEICTEQVTGQIFAMVEAVAVGKERRALELYYDLLALKEPSMRILFLIARQFNQLLQVKLLTGQGMHQKELADQMKLRGFIAGKLMEQARVFSEKQLKEYVELCTSSEEAVKTGRLAEKLAVELVILTISRRRPVVE